MLDQVISNRLDAVAFFLLLGVGATFVESRWSEGLFSKNRVLPLAAANMLLAGAAIFAAERCGAQARKRFEHATANLVTFCAYELERMGHAKLHPDSAGLNPDHAGILDAKTLWLKINPDLLDLYTYRRAPDGTWTYLFPPAAEGGSPAIGSRRQETDESDLEALAGMSAFATETDWRHGRRRLRSVHPLHDAAGRVEALLAADIRPDEWVRTQAFARGGIYVGFTLVHVLLAGIFYRARWHEREVQRKEERRKLIESESRFRSLFQSIPSIAVQGYDQRRRVIFWNAASAELYGYKAEEALGRPLENLIIPQEMQSTVVEAVDRWIEHGTPIPAGELILRRKDGRAVPVFSSHVMQWNSDGEPEMYCIDIDLAERNKALAALQVSEERYRRLFELMPMPMWVYDSDTLGFLVTNDFAIQTYGYSREEFDRMTLRDLLPPGDVPALDELICDSPKGEAHPAGEWRHRKKDGGLLVVEMTSHPFPWAGRRACILVSHDVTARNHAEQRVVEQAQLLERISEAFVVIDVRRRIKYWNRGAEDLFDVARGHAIGQAAQAMIKAGRLPDISCGLNSVSKPGDEWNAELKLTGDKGRSRFIETKVTPLHDDEGNFVGHMAISHDLTKRKSLEAQFLQAQKMEVIGRLAGGIAHDFNSILMAMMLTLEMLEEDVHGHAPALRAVVNMRTMTERARKLTGQLLLFARKQAIKRQTIDLNVALKNVSDMLARLLGADVRLEFVLSEHPLWVRADVSMLDQLVMNLCINSRDAMPHGGKIVLETSSVHFAEQPDISPDARPGVFARLGISDTGHGMSREILGRIFEPFFTTKRPGFGTGLGLATVQGIVRQHHGWIAVKSAEDQGTTFDIFLEKTTDLETPEHDIAGDVKRGSETILLAEDDMSLGAACADGLRRYGYSVCSAPDGGQAFDLWRRNPTAIDLVLTDVVMPGGMSGRELAAKIRAINPSAKILLMTGFNDDLTIKGEARAADGLIYVEKPLQMSVLADAIRKCLES